MSTTTNTSNSLKDFWDSQTDTYKLIVMSLGVIIIYFMILSFISMGKNSSKSKVPTIYLPPPPQQQQIPMPIFFQPNPTSGNNQFLNSRKYNETQ